MIGKHLTFPLNQLLEHFKRATLKHLYVYNLFTFTRANLYVNRNQGKQGYQRWVEDMVGWLMDWIIDREFQDNRIINEIEAWE